MKNPLFKLATRLLLCGVLLAAPLSSLPAQAADAPFVDFSGMDEGDHLGVAGFPALEILPVEDPNTAMIVARESDLKGSMTYSSSYFTPVKKFAAPTYFNVTFYGYHDKPIWKEIKTVTFKFAGQEFAGAALYGVQGPDRDRSQDAQKSDYFELMTVRIPTATARKIANNGGVLVTTDPNSFYLTISASQLDNFKQVVNSIDFLGRGAKAKQSAPQPPQKTVSARKMFGASGLPITEAFEEASGSTTLETALAAASDNLLFQGKAYVAVDGKKLPQPYTVIVLGVVSAKPIWENINAVTLSFGSKKLRLTPNGYYSNRVNENTSVESIAVRVPYKDFMVLARGGKFYVTVGGASFEVKGQQTTGLRELARKIAR